VQQLVDRYRRQLGVGAAATARVVGDAGADEGGVDARADNVDDAGGLTARDPGELGWVEHGTAALGVGEVHADGVDADADLAGRGVGSGTVARVSTSGEPKRVIWIARKRAA